MESSGRITARLLALNRQMDTQVLFPTLVPEAADLALANPYAFCLATCLDRGMKADIVWTIPYWLQQLLGHLDPRRVYQIPMAGLAELVSRLPKRPRYVNDAPRTIHEITQIVVERCNGDAERIWKGRRASEVRSVFLSVYGVGPGIANMAVLLIEKAYGIRFSDLEHRDMDIKPDVHTTLVLYRLGAAATMDPQAAVAAARRMNPSFPGELDGALWWIGREWCAAEAPKCGRCPMEAVCPKVPGS